MKKNDLFLRIIGSFLSHESLLNLNERSYLTENMKTLIVKLEQEKCNLAVV